MDNDALLERQKATWAKLDNQFIERGVIEKELENKYREIIHQLSGKIQKYKFSGALQKEYILLIRSQDMFFLAHCTESIPQSVIISKQMLIAVKRFKNEISSQKEQIIIEHPDMNQVKNINRIDILKSITEHVDQQILFLKSHSKSDSDSEEDSVDNSQSEDKDLEDISLLINQQKWDEVCNKLNTYENGTYAYLKNKIKLLSSIKKFLKEPEENQQDFLSTINKLRQELTVANSNDQRNEASVFDDPLNAFVEIYINMLDNASAMAIIDFKLWNDHMCHLITKFDAWFECDIENEESIMGGLESRKEAFSLYHDMTNYISKRNIDQLSEQMVDALTKLYREKDERAALWIEHQKKMNANRRNWGKIARNGMAASVVLYFISTLLTFAILPAVEIKFPEFYNTHIGYSKYKC